MRNLNYKTKTTMQRLWKGANGGKMEQKKSSFVKELLFTFACVSLGVVLGALVTATPLSLMHLFLCVAATLVIIAVSALGKGRRTGMLRFFLLVLVAVLAAALF